MRSCVVRSCVGCRQRAAKSDLLRLVVVVDGGVVRVVPDPRGRRQGRGASLHADLRCLDLAERRRAFPRAFRLPGPLDATAVRDHLELISGSGVRSNAPREAGREVDEHSMSTKR